MELISLNYDSQMYQKQRFILDINIRKISIKNFYLLQNNQNIGSVFQQLIIL